MKPSFSISTFVNDLSIVGTANIGVFIIGLVQGLIVPKILTVEDYGYWKLFLLYTGFSGLLHLGFTDGIYLQWAGKQMKELSAIIGDTFWVLFIHLTIVALIFLLVFLFYGFTNKNILILALIYAFALNIITFFQFTFQAVRRFRIVSILNLFKPLLFLSSVGILYFLKILDYEKMIYSYIGASLFIFTIYTYSLKENISFPCKKKFRYRDILTKYITSGWSLLFGNFIVFLILNADVMIVGALFTIKEFAFYAFAITILGIFSVFTNTISTVIFPHLAAASTEIRKKAFSLSASVIVLMWGIILGLYPFAVAFISYFLPDYSGTLPYIRVLMLSVAFITTIQILHNNYYKLYFQQTKYFLSTLIVSLLSFVAIFIVARTINDLKIIAVVKVGILLIWFIINELLLMKHIAHSLQSLFKRLLIILYFSLIFYISWYIELIVLQVAFYFLMVLFVSMTFLKNEVKSLRNIRYAK
ncbi:MAG: oligosaccharide flippase family protein [Nitrospirota bacterium]